MMRRMVLSAVMIGLGVLALTTVAAAAGWGEGGFADSPLVQFFSGRVERLKELRTDLNVAPDQRGEIKEVLVSHRTEIVSTMKSLRSAKTELRDLVLSDSSKEAEIRAAAKSLGAEIGDAAVLAAELRGEIAPILTDEQHELIDEFIASNDDAASQFLKEVESR